MKIELEADTVLVAKGFVAKAGDSLVVVNGICLGVKDQPDVAAKVQKLPKGSDPSPEEILTVVYNRGSVDNRYLCDDLRIPRPEAAARARVQHAVRKMVMQGVLAYHPDDVAAKARYPRVIVKKPPPATS